MMRRYIAERLVYTGLLLFMVSILIFVLARLLPGDPIQAAAMINGDLADATIIEDLRISFGLDKPLYVQYGIWLKNFIAGDWGVSIGSGENVREMFSSRLPVTLELFAGSVIWSVIIGFPMGIVAVLRRNTWLDATLTTLSISGVSIPVFWEGIVLIYLFAVTFHLLPPSGFVPFSESPAENLLSVIMPTFVMGTQGAGLFARYVRSSLMDVLGQDYIRTARAKGLSENAILIIHAARPAMIPVVTVVGLAWSYVVAGSFLVEYIFAIPGLGRMGVDAVFARDFPVIQATLIMVALNVLLVNLIVDLLYGYLDPRIRIS
jgi:peptide/nickel transport system permease protein